MTTERGACAAPSRAAPPAIPATPTPSFPRRRDSRVALPRASCVCPWIPASAGMTQSIGPLERRRNLDILPRETGEGDRRSRWWGRPQARFCSRRPSPACGGRWRRRRRKGAATSAKLAATAPNPSSVMAGLDPATQPRLQGAGRLRWVPGSSPGMTTEREACASPSTAALPRCETLPPRHSREGGNPGGSAEGVVRVSLHGDDAVALRRIGWLP
jgi:hypothetical protein